MKKEKVSHRNLNEMIVEIKPEYSKYFQSFQTGKLQLKNKDSFKEIYY
jgi:hypothetical protein